MVTFDATLPGTPVETWRRALDEHSIAAFTVDADRLVVVAAHPDDETLGAAGLIAAADRIGLPVHVVVVTDGGASHPQSPTYRPEQLAEVRAREVRAAIGTIAPRATITFLGYPDGQAAQFRSQITADLTPLIGGDRTLVAAPWRGDGHRDHRVVGEICASLTGSLLEYPIWMWHWATPENAPWADLVSIPVDPELKRAAIEQHASQIAPLSAAPGDEVVLHPSFVEHFRGDREFFVVTTRLAMSYFDDLYVRHDDPWGFESRWYEQRKRELTIASLPGQRYASALEIGCSTGLLTEMLAQRCDSLRAVDVAASAVERARARVGPTVSVEVADVTTAFPRGTYDLVVLSEVGYYFSEAVLDELLDEIEASLAADGTLLACHWRHPVDGYLLTGDAVHARVAEMGLTRVVWHEEEDFVLEVLSRSGDSVARHEGLL